MNVSHRLMDLLDGDPSIVTEKGARYPKVEFQLVRDDRVIVHFKDTDGTKWSISLQRGWELHP